MATEPRNHKTCAKCKKSIPLTNFYMVTREGKKKLYPYCKPCKNKKPTYKIHMRENKNLADEIVLEWVGLFCKYCKDMISSGAVCFSCKKEMAVKRKLNKK